MKITDILLRKQNFERSNLDLGARAKIRQELSASATRAKKNDDYIDKYKINIKILGTIEKEEEKTNFLTLEFEYLVSFENTQEEKESKDNKALAEEVVGEFYNTILIEKIKRLYEEAGILDLIDPPEF